MKTDFRNSITSFGGIAVTAPLSLLVGVLLIGFGAREAGIRWMTGLLLCWVLIAAGKLVFIPCGHLLSWLHLRSPSGHMAGAVALYGGLAVLLARSQLAPVWRRLAIIAGLALSILIGLSRVQLHAHTVPEVLAGVLPGAVLPALLARGKGNLPLLRWRSVLATGVAASILILTITLPRSGFTPEHWISTVAKSLASSLLICRR